MNASFERALGFFGGGNTRMAEQICRGALEDYPQDAKTRRLLGTTLVRQRRYATAEKYLRTVIDMFPDFPKAHGELGNALFGQRHGVEAIENDRPSIRTGPAFVAAYWSLANLKTFCFNGDEVAAMGRLVAAKLLWRLA